MKESRQKKGMSRKELAAAVGCSESMITKVELGVKTPSMSLAGKISKVLGKSVDSLFLRKNQTNSAGQKGGAA